MNGQVQEVFRGAPWENRHDFETARVVHNGGFKIQSVASKEKMAHVDQKKGPIKKRLFSQIYYNYVLKKV